MMKHRTMKHRIFQLGQLGQLGLVLAVAGCKSDEAESSRKKAHDPGGPQLAGVWPDRFQCASITPLEALGTVLGATPKALDNPAPIPRGVPQPCVYEVPAADRLEIWTFDFDCRDGHKQRADTLFAQYKQQNTDLIAHYDQMSAAGAIKPNDAGIEAVRPGEFEEVDVGAKGLDHHGQALLFIDDDAPCYVRVVGPDAPRRLELAKLIAKNLTFANAPMTPRAVR